MSIEIPNNASQISQIITSKMMESSNSIPKHNPYSRMIHKSDIKDKNFVDSIHKQAVSSHSN